MKRIYLLLLSVLLVTGAQAQRVADIQVSLNSPKTTDVVTAGGSFSVDAVIKNLGPDSIKYNSDSVLWYMSVGGGLINLTIGSSSGTTWLRYHKQLKTNDTLHITFNNLTPTGYVSEKDSNRTFCFYAFPRGTKPSDTIKDPVTTNNSACVSFLWKATQFPAAVKSIVGNGTNTVVLYPNPAKEVTNFDFEMVTPAEVSIKVLDAMGRVVLDRNAGTLEAGKHTLPLITNSLASGTYTYQLYIGNNLAVGKLSIEK